jgi:hypothetical protein
MRAKLAISAIVAIALLGASNAMAEWKSEVLIGAESERELQEWASAQPGWVDTQTLNVPAGQLYAIVIDQGSGFAIYSIYVYIRENDGLELLVYRQFAAATTTEDKPMLRLDDSGNLLIKSNSGRIYLTIPSSELRLRSE